MKEFIEFKHNSNYMYCNTQSGKATISKCEICRYLIKLVITVQVEEAENATIFQEFKFSDHKNQGKNIFTF